MHTANRTPQGLPPTVIMVLSLHKGVHFVLFTLYFPPNVGIDTDVDGRGRGDLRDDALICRA